MIQSKEKKRFFIAMSLGCVFLIAAESFGAEQIHRAGLSVETHKKKDETRTRKESFTIIEKSETVTLELDVENSSKERDTYHIVWGSLANRLTRSKETEKVVVESGEKAITLDAEEVYTNAINLKPFVFKVTDYCSIKPGYLPVSAKWEEGDTYLGYIVLVMVGDEVIAEESNSSCFLSSS